MNREKTLDTQIKPIIPPVVATPVEAVKVAAAEQISPKPTRRWRARVFQAYLVLATVSFGILVVLASMTNYFSIDLSITRAVQSINVSWFAGLMSFISIIGYIPQMLIVVGVIALLLFVVGLRWEAIMALAASGGSSALSSLIKIVVHRPRPGTC